MNPVIIFTEEPSGYCPVQAEGTVDGFPFYFRSRYDTWTVYIATNKDSDPLDEQSWVNHEAYPSGGQFSAGYAPREECVEFISKCAKLWAARKVEEPQ